MGDLPTNDEEDRRKAAELYASAKELEARGNYAEAVKAYEQSLDLHNDESVMAAYLKALSAIGPM